MARHSETRFETGKDIAAMLPALLSATQKGNSLEKKIRARLALACGYISAGDQTELSRRQIYAAAEVSRELADIDGGKYADALALYAAALSQFAVKCDYNGARAAAAAAVDAARAANRAARAA